MPKPPSSFKNTRARPKKNKKAGLPFSSAPRALPLIKDRKAKGEPFAPGTKADRSAFKTENGTYWLYGLHPAEAALLNPHRKIRHILVTAETELQLLKRLSEREPDFRWPIPPEITQKETLTKVCGEEAVHQGVVLLVSPLSPPDILDIAEQQRTPLLVLDQVTDPRNIGAILRSAAAFGVGAVIMQTRHAPAESGVLAKAASGALEKVPLLQVVNLSRALESLKKAGYWVVGMEVSENILNGEAYHGKPTVLVLGAEGSGLRRLVREHCDELAGLKIHNQIESLNVSNAAAIGLYELTRSTRTPS
ncbi:23S rRNA (guanosine(2251)-2'-O)-methyltransferase RlmB [Entomobacter blattae]|uniref:23S rRNA (Guanosine-2'-O-)-methyltransferase RlmB n=1 Tax=Entomobacter blattae TaxID=2762277 RepID=A0A7H1NQV8_9PROT|nr:23S rRNA (guanosine(2251)-2'-O)-methyltransferase RlmB [Entomobacter blattae]QNT78168.1 23S rRNA (guanosine-2'-O-)-methyltransferase RlmB [Entomobacter blattae]